MSHALAPVAAPPLRPPRLSDRSLFALAALNLFLADARDGLGPFLDAFLATRGWSPFTLGLIATVGGLIGLAATPFCGALVDRSPRKRMLIAAPVVLITATALLTLLSPHPTVVWAGQIGTALAGAIIAPALTGLILGLVGERLFPHQVARNEFWNHAGNFASLFAIYLLVMAFGLAGVIGLMIATAMGALVAVAAIDPGRIDHQVARGLAQDDGAPGPSGLSVLLHCRGLAWLALLLMVFHFANAPMSRLIARQFSVELGTPFRTTALITGVAQATMIAVAAAPVLIRRFGLRAVFLIALAALPVRGMLAGTVPEFRVIYPVQMLDGLGAGLLGITAPVAAERLLSGTGRFNPGFAAVMAIQGVGASLSNVVAGWIVSGRGYGASHWAGAVVAALPLFVLVRKQVAPDEARADAPS